MGAMRDSAAPAGTEKGPSKGAHVAYLALICVLVLLLVVLGGRAMRAHRTLKEVEARFGLGDGGRAVAPRPAELRSLSRKELLRERTFEEYRREVDALLERAAQLGEFGDESSLAAACGLAVQGGKRLRPIILLEIARALGAAQAEAAAAQRLPPPIVVDPADGALFLEYLHSSSLVVDDLPAFDDDAERRGQPSLHASTSPAVAQMAAVSLLGAAFQNICRQVDWIRDHCPGFKNVDQLGTKLCGEVSRALGAAGAAGGQYLDACVPPEQLLSERGPEVVEEIMRLKTGVFFEVAFVGGWLFGGGGAAQVPDLREAGRQFGLAFQVADDLGDMSQDRERVRAGKPGWNFANFFGVSAAERQVARSLHACRRDLERYSLYTPLWREIFQKVWRMAGEAGAPLAHCASGPPARGEGRPQGGEEGAGGPRKAGAAQGGEPGAGPAEA
jgi:geranylgeranyl diphosphate synthase type II